MISQTAVPDGSNTLFTDDVDARETDMHTLNKRSFFSYLFARNRPDIVVIDANEMNVLGISTTAWGIKFHEARN